MKTLTRKLYYCDHCNKMYLTKGHCKNHETKCSSNPDNFRDCFDCKGLIVDYPTITDFDKNGNKIKSKNINVFYCNLIDMYVIPPKAEHKGNAYKLDKMNVTMPKKCNAKEPKTFEDFLNDFWQK